MERPDIDAIEYDADMCGHPRHWHQITQLCAYVRQLESQLKDKNNG